MPDASGFLTTSDVRRIRRMAQEGFKTAEIARVIGCSTRAVHDHSGSFFGRVRRAAQYARFVALASAHVPTFGGGR